MDKDLKRLSRVELLELMVSLSDDYEQLADENNQLKEMLSAQRLPESTKVGSIAEAALQLGGFFEAAQRSADEYLREIVHLRDELSQRVSAQEEIVAELQGNVSEQRAQQMQFELERVRAEAQARADEIIARASEEADAIRAEAYMQAEEILANANRQSHEMLSASRKKAGSKPGIIVAPRSYAPSSSSLPSSYGKASFAATVADKSAIGMRFAVGGRL